MRGRSPRCQAARGRGSAVLTSSLYFDGKAGLLYQIVRENNAPQWKVSLDVMLLDVDPFSRILTVLETWAGFDRQDPWLLAVMQACARTWPTDKEAEKKADREQFKTLIVQLVEEGKLLRQFPD